MDASIHTTEPYMGFPVVLVAKPKVARKDLVFKRELRALGSALHFTKVAYSSHIYSEHALKSARD